MYGICMGYVWNTLPLSAKYLRSICGVLTNQERRMMPFVLRRNNYLNCPERMITICISFKIFKNCGTNYTKILSQHIKVSACEVNVTHL